jgi:peptide/nickel transport system substrate-binding protein
MGKATRRDVLIGGAAFGALAAGFLPDANAQASRKSVAISMNRDIQGWLAPPYRLSFQENNILRSVCEGLIAFKPNRYEWELSAAKRIEQVDDKTIEFELKPGRMFHDDFGEMTAEDVKWSFEQYAVPAPDGKQSNYQKDWAALDRIEVTGKYTGRILLKAPSPQLWLVVLPEGSGLIYSRKAWEAGCYRSDQQPVRVIGTGAYKFAEWVPNQRIVLRRNDEHPELKPAFDELVIRPVRDPKTAELALRADELQFSVIEPANAAEFEKLADTTVLRRNSINFIWIGINVEKPPLDQLKLRQAIRAAIDVDQVLQGAYNGTVAPAYGVIAPGLLGYWQDAPKYKRDVALAKKLLAEAGMSSGVKLRLTLLNRPAFQSVGQIVQAMLGEVGIQLDLDIQDAATFWSMGKGDNGKNLELSLQRFSGKADPAFQTQWFVQSQIGEWNWQRWKSPQYDELYAKAGSTSHVEERAQGYIAMQKLMDESSAFLWLTHEANIFAYRKWLAPAILPNGDDMLYSRFALA